MKSLRLVSSLLLLVGMIGIGSSTLADSKTVVVTNSTSYTLTGFFASPSVSTSDWDTSNNLLGGATLGPGQTTTITIADGLARCHYDLMGILYGITQYAYSYSVNACDHGSWSITVS